MLKVGVFGATGRVGRLLIDEIPNCKDIDLISVFARSSLEFNIPKGVLVTDDMKTFLEINELIIDFSTADATKLLLQLALKLGLKKCLVVGTTGFDEETISLLKEASKNMPILSATNMSLGMAVLNKVISSVSRDLKDFNIEITEIHHKHKIDAPSGSAITLGTTCAKARGLTRDSFVTGREGIAKRSEDEIGILSLRGGDVVGRHVVGFYGDGEFLELTHNATSRSTFAKGALSASKWLADKPAGLYSMQDIFRF